MNTDLIIFEVIFHCGLFNLYLLENGKQHVRKHMHSSSNHLCLLSLNDVFHHDKGDNDPDKVDDDAKPKIKQFKPGETGRARQFIKGLHVWAPRQQIWHNEHDCTKHLKRQRNQTHGVRPSRACTDADVSVQTQRGMHDQFRLSNGGRHRHVTLRTGPCKTFV
jgi:hypothetical protein